MAISEQQAGANARLRNRPNTELNWMQAMMASGQQPAPVGPPAQQGLYPGQTRPAPSGTGFHGINQGVTGGGVAGRPPSGIPTSQALPGPRPPQVPQGIQGPLKPFQSGGPGAFSFRPGGGMAQQRSTATAKPAGPTNMAQQQPQPMNMNGPPQRPEAPQASQLPAQQQPSIFQQPQQPGQPPQGGIDPGFYAPGPQPGQGPFQPGQNGRPGVLQIPGQQPPPMPQQGPMLAQGAGNVNTSIQPQNVYDQGQIRQAQNVAASNAVPAIGDLRRAVGQPGFSGSSPAYQARMGAMAGQMGAQGAGQVGQIGQQMGWQNANNQLAGQQAREQEALGWAGLGTQQMGNQLGFQNQLQGNLLGFLQGTQRRY